jgi:hypothetical protein
MRACVNPSESVLAPRMLLMVRCSAPYHQSKDPDSLILGAAPGRPIAPIRDPTYEVYDSVALVWRDGLVGMLVQQPD